MLLIIGFFLAGALAVAVFEHIRRPRLTPALRGFAVAQNNGCFACHGPGGRVGSTNPGSFEGYIPPWQGEDYAELVRNDDELRNWILHGKIDRLESNPVARFFTRRQVIQMPAYRDVLTDSELESLMSYIEWFNHES